MHEHVFPTCRYQGHVSAALVLGGVDFKGPHLFTVSCHAAAPCLRSRASVYAAKHLSAILKTSLCQEAAPHPWLSST